MKRPEDLWAGNFGNGYIARNRGPHVEAASLRLLTAALGAERLTTALEVGANIGINLANLQRLFPDAQLSAIEINP